MRVAMHLAATIELSITRNAAGNTIAGMRVELPTHRADLAENVAIPLDDVALRALTINPKEYAEQLTDMVFGRKKLREAWERARGFAEGTGGALQVRLVLHGDDELHGLHWELLHDPIDETPLAHQERVRFSRFLSTTSLAEVKAAARPDLQAVLVAANPPRLPARMAPVDVGPEIARAQHGLGDIPAVLLDGEEGRPRATLPAIAAALRDGAHLLYLVCHGALVQGQPYLWLEQEDGESHEPVAGDDLVQMITRLEHRPLLIVLASCQGAGDTYQTLTAIGPKLTRVGVGAVVAMQGNVPMELVVRLMPRLFAELRRDGQIDRALAVARVALPASSEWWMPVLWMAVRDGALWHEETASSQVAQMSHWHLVHSYPMPHNWATDEERAAAATRLAALPTDVVPEPQDVLPPGSWMGSLTRNRQFVGREENLVDLARALKGGESVAVSQMHSAVASGLGGIGKTQLAVEFTYRYGQHFAGVFWLSFAEPDAIPAEFARCGGAAHLQLFTEAQGLSLNEQAALVRARWASGLPYLLIFDNCEDPELVRAYHPGGAVRVLITSRRGDWPGDLGVRQHALDVLHRAESIALLRQHRPELDELEADTLAAELGDLPLALHLAGRFLTGPARQLSIERYLAELRSPRIFKRLPVRDQDGSLPTGHNRDVARTFALSYERLDSQQAEDELALRMLARAAYLISGEVVATKLLLATLLQPDHDLDADFAFEEALSRLIELGLLEREGDAGVRMHRLVGAYVRQVTGDAEAQGAVERTVLDVVGQLVDALNMEQVDESVIPVSSVDISEGEASVRILAILPYLRVVTERAAPRDDEIASHLCNQLALLLEKLGDYKGALPYLERSLAIRERIGTISDVDIAQSLFNLGVVVRHLGEYERAKSLLERALVIHKSTSDSAPINTANIHNVLGDLLQDLDKYDEAREHYVQALEIQTNYYKGEHPDIADTLTSVGVLANEIGLGLDAQSFLEEALGIRKRILGLSHPDTARSYNTLSVLFAGRRSYLVAKDYAEQALAIDEAFYGPKHPLVATDISNLASIIQELGDFTQARNLYDRALEIYNNIFGDDHPAVAQIYHSLCFWYRGQNDLETARDFADRALHIHLKVFGEENSLTALSYETLGNVLLHQGDELMGEQYLKRAHAIEVAIFGEDHPRVSDPEPGAIAYRRPSYYLSIPEEERDLRVHCNEDLCVIDEKQFFIRGVLRLPIADTEDFFEWGVWAEVSESDFQQYLEHLDQDEEVNLPEIVGHLANEVETYEGSGGLEISIHLQGEALRPLFMIISKEHQLGIDQNLGVTEERVAQFWQALG